MLRSRRGLVFFVFLVACLYTLISAAIAIQTVDTCGGDVDYPKRWRIFPPEWVCGESGPPVLF
ncbi:MAG: hypothetical protein KatS3mg008_0136 [Acidimicrobiales bacterium]|nr:MAG: hypothetical protein KatS3mg008_0136 [Acidimicrobiales bacterium]